MSTVPLCSMTSFNTWQFPFLAVREVSWWPQLHVAAACLGGAAGRQRLDSAGSAGDSSGGRLGWGSGCVRHQSQGGCIFQRQRPGLPLSAVCLCETACAYVLLFLYTYEDHRLKIIQYKEAPLQMVTMWLWLEVHVKFRIRIRFRVKVKCWASSCEGLRNNNTQRVYVCEQLGSNIILK